MRIEVLVLTTVLGMVSAPPTGAGAQIEQKKAAEQQIEEALSALPESMREDATVKGFDESGSLVVLREGSSAITCRADDPSVRAWIVHCYPEELEAFVARSEELRKEGVDTPARIKTLTSEISSGAIQLPDIAVIYARQGNSVDIASGVVIAHVPNATGRSTGLPTLPTRGSPWLAETGTPMANIRIAVR